MSNLSYLMQGFVTALSWQNILAVFGGGIIGLILGAMPGLGSLAGVALLLPLTFRFNPTTGIIMLAALYFANMYGGCFQLYSVKCSRYGFIGDDVSGRLPNG